MEQRFTRTRAPLAIRQLTHYNRLIKSFHSRALQRFFETGDAAGLPPALVLKIGDALAAIDTAETPSEVALFPGWRLHPLKGGLVGYWSVSINRNWRIVFRFSDGDAHDVDFLDYH